MIYNALTIDLEEYFHASEVQEYARPVKRPLPSRIAVQVERTLEALAGHGVKSTFFIVGSVAESRPDLIRRIVDEGHDIGCHSYAHRLVYQLTPKQFREDTVRAVESIGQACGIRPTAYRAPSYSIVKESLWALEILVELGFTHDSSIYPIQHDRYGIPGFRRHAHDIMTPVGAIHEVPIATVQIDNGCIAPVGGGAYLRLLPYRYTAAGIRRINTVERMPACIYFHPWELDPDQPRLQLTLVSRLRTYSGLRTMASKIGRLLTDFAFQPMISVFPSSTPERAPNEKATGEKSRACAIGG